MCRSEQSLSETPIYLGSASPRRAELLQQIGVAYTQLVAEIDETPQQQERPEDYVCRLAEQKAKAVWQLAQRSADRPVLAADTCIALNGRIYGKPADYEEARNMLRCLSGKSHQVLTAVCLYDAHFMASRLSVTRVSLKELSESEISNYLASGEPLGKAGGYAIQGRAAMFIRNINGSYSGVMGLPLYETAQLLQDYKKHRKSGNE